MNKAALLKWLSYWPPYLGAGVRVTRMEKDFSIVEVEMNLRFWNQNYVGTHFGGSLYSMVDPFLALMIIQNLGSKYVVWDKAATILFKKPGRGRVRARIELSPDQVQSLKEEVDRLGKVEPIFQIKIIDDQAEVVAEVEKTLHVRRKKDET